MSKTGRTRGFSLIEIVVVLATLTILASALLPVLSKNRGIARRATCLSNLRQFGIGLQGFFDDRGRYPEGDLATSLRPYMAGSAGVFCCPMDARPDIGDSYSDYYCPRWERKEDTAKYVVGCARHDIGTAHTTTVLYSLGEAGISSLADTRWNGDLITPGVQAVGGVLTFSDGSQTTIVGIHQATLITSFRLKDPFCYTVLRVQDGQQGTLDNSVTPGSKFEVITPAAVAGVEGTRFTVLTSVDAQKRQHSLIAVSSGTVRVTGFDATVDPVSAGGQAERIGPMFNTMSGATTPPLAEGVVYIRDRYYYRGVDPSGSAKLYTAHYNEYDIAQQKAGKDAGEEQWKRSSATRPWNKIKDTFTPND